MLPASGSIVRRKIDQFTGKGLWAREHHLAGRAMAGAALVVEDTVAHLMAFPATAWRNRRPQPGVTAAVTVGRHDGA
jgi:hypothetical protein